MYTVDGCWTWRSDASTIQPLVEVTEEDRRANESPMSVVAGLVLMKSSIHVAYFPNVYFASVQTGESRETRRTDCVEAK